MENESEIQGGRPQEMTEHAAENTVTRPAEHTATDYRHISMSRRVKGGIVKGLMTASFIIILALVLGLIGYIAYRGIPHVTWKLLSASPSVLNDTIGILPNILNTLYIVLITLLIVLPLGIGTAVYLTEYATNAKTVSVIEFAVETLAGIPSIIYGLVGMLPTIIRTTQESLKTVPNSYREGSLALGSGKWHMIRTVVLPSSIDGIVTGCILAIGRIVGESAALLFTAGMANNIMGLGDAFLPNHAGSTLTVALYMYAKERGEFDVAFAIAAILLVLTLLINFSAKLVAKRLKKKTVAN